MYEISVTRTFAAAHAIRLHDGTRESLHGHNWTVTVAIAASDLDAIETVMDFHELGRRIDAVVAPWQNANLDDCAPFYGKRGRNSTAEAVAHHVGTAIAAQLPEPIRMVYCSVTEAPGCVATWRA